MPPTDRKTPSTRSASRPSSGRRWLIMAGVVVLLGTAVGLLMRPAPQPAGGASDGPVTFTEVGRNGPVFTVSVAPDKTADEPYLMKIAEQLSAREVQKGGSGQISVMVWPNTVAVPKQPPTTETDASMRTQAAGIFINPKMNVKHLIRFKDGQTISERDFGRPVQ